MLQGTGSHVGKTVLTAALCRAFRDDGLDVAPFKAQNMALNAYVTGDGGEIGWAQAMQAEAAGLEPSVEMNPILLKPQTGGCQVIVHGKVWATLSASEYFARRSELREVVRAAYARLARGHELIVIEGAGSPAEPNLQAVDLVNMAMARMAGAPVILVGDIDRGGVFAAFVGTLALLPRADRRRVRGFLVNRFRGDAALLAPALDFLARRTRRPVLGVVPFVPDLHLPEEDSVALDVAPPPRPAGRPVVAVVRLPHIANFTDFEPLAADPTLDVRYARRPEELADAALVILPGSKDTLADLRWLHASGFADALRAHRAAGGHLAGICGGFQMLGQHVDDPDGLEGGGRAIGLGCLPVTTVLAPGKVTRRVRARLAPDGVPFEAYEIHVGRTRTDGPLAPLALVEEGGGQRADGAVSADGRVWGTYLHGLFDAPAVRTALCGSLRVPPDAASSEYSGSGAPGGGVPAPRRPAAPTSAARDYRALREEAYARLAAQVRQSVDLSALRALARSR
jgi:adenosylcobyric acid synthase